jgi:RNA polymerase sigma-70 factor (ECF subfamily)
VTASSRASDDLDEIEGESFDLEADRRLARSVLSGDEIAFREMYERVAPALYRMVRARVNDREQVKDIVQNTLCKAMENLVSYRGEGPLLSWFYGVCRFEVMAYYRQKKRAPDPVELFPESADVHNALSSLRGAVETPDDRLRKNETARLLHWTLDHLPSRYGKVLEWKYAEGLSVVEIAQHLDVSPKAAESILTRARVAFKKAFDTARTDMHDDIH